MLGGAVMPFRDYSFFDGITLKAMSAAYDAAIDKLGIKTGDPLTSSIATRIAALASEGERDPVKLCAQAIAALDKASRPPR
jgi:hypothetical protein